LHRVAMPSISSRNDGDRSVPFMYDLSIGTMWLDSVVFPAYVSTHGLLV